MSVAVVNSGVPKVSENDIIIFVKHSFWSISLNR
jgi:hypothetical protein